MATERSALLQHFRSGPLRWPAPFVGAVAALLLFITPSSAHADAASIEAAHQAYGAGRFDEAVKEYSAALKAIGPNASLFYDLGNALYRSGKLPEAVVAYRRALLLDPYDQDILYNLGLARERLPSAIRVSGAGTLVPPTVVRAVRLSLPPAQFEMLGMLAYIAFWLCYASLSTKPTPTKRRALNCFGAVVCWVCFTSWILRDSGTGATALSPTMPDSAAGSVVVMGDNVAIHSGNSETFGVILGLSSGSELLAGEVRNEWREVFLPDGRSGWAKSSQLAEITPSVDNLLETRTSS